ncbi:hypothetical protein ASZ78_007432 [Callipepla squamata]|uniref:non-specific serine/threonine protein kinase n=1 Tax=Callipepla squamata TaxID=9009 RepID=A0A226MZV8_CALSU|nr:hypothetical protein ASZ78_007432 [Callipepla squamata]
MASGCHRERAAAAAAAAGEEEALRKLLVRLRYVQEGKRPETLVQTLSDLLELAARQSGKGRPLPACPPGSLRRALTRLSMGWSLLCKLIEICPSTLQNIALKDVGKDWEVLGVHHTTYNLFFYLDVIAFLLLEEEVDVFSLIFNAMHTFPKNEEIQQHGCRALYKLFEKVPEEQLTEFVESKDHMIILEVFKEFPEKEEVILPALYSLHSLAGPPSNVEVLMSGNVRCYNVIVEMMKNFPNSETVQEVCCCLLHKLTLGNFYNILVLHKVPEVIVKAVEMYSENAKLQAAALSCLALLSETDCKYFVFQAETIFLNRDLEERKEEEEEEKLCWLEACYRALELHRKNMDVLYFVFQAETIFLNRDLEERKEEEEEEKLCWLEACYRALELHRKNMDVLEIYFFEKVAVYLRGSKEVFASLLSIVSDTKNDQNSSSRNMGDAAFTLTVKVMKSQCLLEGTHSLVLGALNRFIGNPSIQRCGLKLLTSVAECTGALEILTQQGATDTVLHTLQMYPDEQGMEGLFHSECLNNHLNFFFFLKDIQSLGLSLLLFLLTRKSLCIATMHVLATVLVSTLRRFKEVTEIQMHGFRAVLSILGFSPCFAKLLIHESFDTVIFYQMSMCFTSQRDRQFQSLCCKCFAKIAENDDLKNMMLEKACIECNSIMAECLLLLGADINKKTKTDSFIYQVCEKGNNPKLVELLLANGAREQDIRSALTISIKRGDSQIISLLLKKLSLDVANSSICLGGFGIGRLEPSWLIPLFPDKLTPPRRQNAGSALARMVLKYQMKNISENRSESCSDLNFSEDGVDKNYDWNFISDPLVDTVFPLSDDIDSEGSEGSLFRKKKSNSIAVADLYCREIAFQRGSPTLPRHSYSVGPGSDYEPLVKQRRKLLHSDEPLKGISKSSLHLRPSDSLSSLISEKECIKSLDLSSNELENIDAIGQNSSLTSHLEHLDKLELHQNALTNIPEQLCENLKCLTYLDLHSNRFTSFPTYLLKMNCITYLDISRNDIGPSFALDPHLRCPTLKQLNLSYNQLMSIPEFLANVAENLEQLLLEGNKISCLSSPLSLKELKILNISKNNISSLAENVFMSCTKLELFNARMNVLEIMPDLSSSITTLKLSQNCFINVPETILLLPHLRSVDLSQNKILSLPGPVHWKSLNLRELLFNHNQIGVLDLSEKACAWSRLEKLHLSNNKLKEIPPQIGFLENLTSLDVSHNPDLRFFPDEMGRLSKIWDLPLEGLHLNLDFKHVGCKARDIIRFLQQRLKKAVPYNRMKLMIVGNTGSGKTTLLQQLMRCKRTELGCPKATVGIDVKDWIIQGKGKMKKELVLNVWDFGGQEEFYSTHPHFMTQRALYLAVYDLSKGEAEVDAMKPWLFNIKARASTSPVILVGTHLDVSNEKQHKDCMSKITRELLNKRGFPAIQDYHFVNAKEESDSIMRLRKIIIKESLHFKIRDQPVVGQLIPDSYLELEKRILLERKNVPVEFPVIDQKRLLEMVQENKLQLDENELPHAIHFLNESGVLLHFQDPALQLRDLYFVDPKWLCKIMAQILTVKVEGFSKYPKGIVKRSDVEKFLLKKSKFPKIYMSQYFKLLEKFQIALPLGEDQLLIPSSLSDHRPVIELPHCENSEIIIRLYEMPYFPMGFWSRLINRLLEISPYMLSGRARALRPNRMYWRQGIYLNWSPEAYCLVESAVFDNNPDSFLKITAPSCRKGCILLGQVVDHIDSLMEEWFPGLLDIDVCGEGETLLKKWALYSFEDGEEHQKILLDDLLKKAEEGDLLVNPDQPRHTIPIAQIAPDLILADLPRNIMLNSDELEFDKAPEFLLGDGGFGSVYRASYGGEEVAVKIFNKHTSLRLLRQELAVLCHLHHPSLVSLLAAAVRPRMLVMELALKGSLDRLLQQDKANLTRTLQHRIALHVADGLRYLHSAMIIYRDLKPHNVLLFTLYPNAAVIAKIADYGIAQYCCRMGIKTSEGTPGFRAPEVARGNVIYNQQADVYSFGLLLYDILTGGGRIMEGVKFPNEFDELAIQGKLPDPVKEYGCAPWPKVEHLIKKCLKENPQERPTSSQVYEILNSAELICLMRYISIPSTSTAECMVAANQSCKKAGVWIGNGNTEKAQLSFVNLNTEGHTCEDIADSKILSLALVTLPTEKENWIVAGTHSGSLWAVNTEDETRRHRLQKMSDSITCLYCNSLSKQSAFFLKSLFYFVIFYFSKQKNFFLVGTADGTLAVFEDRAVKFFFCWMFSVVLTGVLSSRFCHNAYSDANIISIAVDKSIYLAKKNSHFVEIWDKKTEKLSELIDCAHFLKDEVEKLNKESKHNVAYSGRVKTICLQKNTALWVGTGGGHILLLDLSTRRPVRVIDNFCDSIRVMLTAQLGGLKNVVLVLGYCYKSDTEDDKYHKELQSCVSVWDINLPHEVQNLKKHIEVRQELAEKMKSFTLD